MDFPSVSAQQPDGNAVDPRVYLRAIYRRRWVVLGIVATVVGLTALWTLRQPKVYQGSTSVIIDTAAPRVLEEDVGEVVENGTGTYWFNKEYYETQYKVIVSRAVSQRVVDKLRLHQDLPFLGVDPRLEGEAKQAAIRRKDPVALLQARISVEPVKDSRVIYITVTDPEPKRAALLANEVAEAYISENLDLRLRITQNASKWLEERLYSLDKASKQSELSVFEFRKDADMLSTSLEDRANIVSQRLTAISEALTDVTTRIAALRARVTALHQARSTLKQVDVPFAPMAASEKGEDLSRELRSEFFKLRAQCAELSDRYLSGHPSLAACAEKLAAVERDLQRSFEGIIRTAELDLNEASEREKNLNLLLKQAKEEAFEVNKKKIAFDQLKREADNNQRLYDLVLKRLKDIELSALLRTSNVRVLDAARPTSRPVKPNVRMNILIALALGLAMGVAFALTLEFLDTTVKTREHVEELLRVAFLGVIPSIEHNREGSADELVVHTQPRSIVAECCRSIRANLLFMSPDKPLRTILVTSSGPQDGKTTTAASLAITMAENGNRVLLVDADMRRPRVHKIFNLNNGAGLSSLILGEGKLEEVVRTTEVPNLAVLTCGPVPPNPAELLHTSSFANLLEQMSEKYDRVIIDSPPVGAVADALVVGTQVDGTLLVLKAARTSREVARRTIQALTDVNARIFGAVINDLDFNDRGYRGYYEYSRYGYYSEKAA